MGVALGSKLTISGATAAMAIGVIFLVPPGVRRRAFGVFLAGVVATAGFWFLRNLIHAGNPLPWTRHIGPIDLPGPNRGLEGRDDYTVAHYILSDPSTSLWRAYFLNPIENLLGPLWFLILGGAAAWGGAGRLAPALARRAPGGSGDDRGRDRVPVHPADRGGPGGAPARLRDQPPLPDARPGARPRAAAARAAARPRLACGCPCSPAALIALFLTSHYSDANVAWKGAFASIPWAALMGILFVAVPIGLALLARRRAMFAALAGAVLAVAIAAVGWAKQDDYFAHRYSRAEDFRFQLDDAVRWAKPTSDLRIAVAGTSGAYNQYGFYGDDVSNYVQYIGRHLPEADFRAIESCPAFRRAVNDGDYDYLVTTPALDLNNPSTAETSPERGWVINDPAVEEIVHSGRVSVFRINGELDPAGCGTANRRGAASQPGGSVTVKK